MKDTLLRRLAQFVVDLDHADLPAGVVERVRLQHLSAAGSLRELRQTDLAQSLSAAVGKRGRAAKVTGGSASARGALQLHATLLGAWGWEDELFVGTASSGAVCAAWSVAKGRTVEELIVATAAANEVAGRLGAAVWLGAAPVDTKGEVYALAAATAAGKLAGLDVETMIQAMALAVTGAPRLSDGRVSGGGPTHGEAVAAAVLRGFDAVAAAKKGERAEPAVLEMPGGVLERGAVIPLRAAFTGLGEAWLTLTLSYKQIPGPLEWHAPIQGVREVLRRHIKAADKRLRADQVDRIELALPAPAYRSACAAVSASPLTPWNVPWRLQSAVAALVSEHALGGRLHQPDVWDKHSGPVADVAQKVHITHDWDLTLGLMSHAVDVWAPLLAGMTRGELRALWSMAREEGLVAPGLGARELLGLLKIRPDRMLHRMRYSTGQLADVPLREWEVRSGARVRVYTTRGGAWPEVREIPECSPGWSWSQTVQGVVDKHAGEGESDASRALLDVDASAPAVDWVKSLFV